MSSQPVKQAVVRSVSALIVVAAVAVPVGAGWRWTRDAPEETRSTPAASLDAADLADYRAFAAGPGAEAPVIISYHDIAPGRAEARTYDVTPTALEEQMAMLKAAGFVSITVDQLVGYMAGEPVPPRSVLITFDDGTKGVRTWADKILERHGFTAVAFVITGSVDTSPYYLSWRDLRALRDSGRWDVEAHTHAGHVRVAASATPGDVGAFLLTRKWLPLEQRLETIDEWTTRVTTDLDLSITRLTDEGFRPPQLFAHPFAAVSVPTNDPSTPALLAGIVAERFVASVANTPDATALTPEDIAAGHLPRVAVRSATTAHELFGRLAAASVAVSEPTT